jgi:uncharacterized protein with PQ loop repeat
MRFDIIDENVSIEMNVFIVIANILNLFYNLPQMWTTYKRKSTGDISAVFLSLRFVTNCIWIAYAVEINSLLFLMNNIVTVFSSLFVGYYKILEEYKKRREVADNISYYSNDL